MDGNIYSFVDFRSVPFTVPGSNFVIFIAANCIRIFFVEYEKPLQECAAATIALDESLVKISDIYAENGHVQLGDIGSIYILRNKLWGHFRMTDGWVLREERSGSVECRYNLNSFQMFSVLDCYGESGEIDLDWDPFTVHADKVVREWMDKKPKVLPERDYAARVCWWVLGTNMLVFRAPDMSFRRAVVPSKIGYVGQWQWDSYFIAIGLAHGDEELALEQMRTAIDFALPNGQLPDVVFPEGILASSDDLPLADREKLEIECSPSVGKRHLPLTKPPLTAWSVERICEQFPLSKRREIISSVFEGIRKSQDWWFRESDLDGDGVPEYLHPYSSGLDDSPVFDHDLPVVSPDLIAYLVVQDSILEMWAEEAKGSYLTTEEAETFKRQVTARRTTVLNSLLKLWDEDRSMFVARAQGTLITDRTVLSLLGVFAADLPAKIIDGIVSDIDDRQRFQSDYPIPTVAMDEKEFDEETMWRGPTWMNTTYLISDGLERAGRIEKARELREAIMRNVEACGQPVEYLNPRTGEKCQNAVPSFGWTAALYIDCARREYLLTCKRE
ncbi:hypothetical protein QS713_02245 [Gleimia hominis]|uniref:Mannosylglycerate hydrolase MGH1-like glycoside hydrolase domain-containing protein n=1 Tax=Gleimia hominis TaxID=595468 RepID=A0ABU3I942_9ACTO|nr:hypothetical protein [Gleimia hominis]MDT3766885.1 hypothetical protein [Gleimia hominis]